MKERFIAFDVETPNAANRRISAIGISVIEEGRIVDSFYSLVDPRQHFDAFNVQLTGISPALVKGSPDFPALWPQIRELLEGGILVAHNAQFDLKVLYYCLRDHGISWRPLVPYVCTCRMGRTCEPGLENHKLSTMCRAFGIPLDHHHAGSDSNACAGLLLHYMENGADADRFVRIFDMDHGKTLSSAMPGSRRKKSL